MEVTEGVPRSFCPPASFTAFGTAQSKAWCHLGAGATLGLFGADRLFLGKPLLPVSQTNSSDLLHEHHHGASDPNFDSTGTVGGVAWLGVSLHASRIFPVDFELAGEAVALAGVLVESVAESVAFELTF